MPDSPRKRVLSNLKLANTHYGVVHGPDFQSVADLALLQVVKDVSEDRVGGDMAERYSFIAGAQYMLETLQNISNSEPEHKEVQRTDRLITPP